MKVSYRVNGKEELKGQDTDRLLNYKSLSDTELYKLSKDIVLLKATTLEEISLFNELLNRDFFNLSIFVGFMPEEIDNTARYTISMSEIDHQNQIWRDKVPIRIPFELKDPMNIALGYEASAISVLSERMSERVLLSKDDSELGMSINILPTPDSYLLAMDSYVNDKKSMLLSLISIGDIVESITKAKSYYEKETEGILKYLHDGAYKSIEEYKNVDSIYSERLLLSLINRVEANYNAAKLVTG